MENKFESCPCYTVKELIKRVEDSENEFIKHINDFAVIKTKLNMLMGISGAIAISTLTILVEFILK